MQRAMEIWRHVAAAAGCWGILQPPACTAELPGGCCGMLHCAAWAVLQLPAVHLPPCVCVTAPANGMVPVAVVIVWMCVYMSVSQLGGHGTDPLQQVHWVQISFLAVARAARRSIAALLSAQHVCGVSTSV
jgi:hypothetical protein